MRKPFMPISWNPISRSFAGKLLLFVIPIALLGIGTLGTYTYLVVREHILTSVSKEMETLGNQAGLTLSAFFRQRLNDLETVSESPLLQDYTSNRRYGLVHEAESYRSELEKYFLKFSERVGVYDRILFVDEGGLEVCRIESSKVMGPRARFNDPPLLLRLKAMGASGTYRSPLKADPAMGPTVRYAKPLYDPSSEYRGAIILDCSMAAVQKILNGLSIGRSGWAYLTNSSGDFIIGNPQPEGSRPSEFLTTQALIPNTEWKVRVGARLQDFLEPLEKIKQLTLILGMACGVLVAFFIYFKVRALTRPIRRLVEAVRRLQAGDLSGRVPGAEIEDDEIGTLSKSFNTMAGSLQDRTRDLEERVRQLSALRDMEGTVIQRKDEETILRACLKAVSRGLAFDRTALYWVDEQHSVIVGRYLYGSDAVGLFEDTFQKRQIEIGGPDILNEVIRTRRSEFLKDVGSDSRLNTEYIRESGTNEFVMAPICGQDRVFGVLAADNCKTRRPLRESDRDGLTLFANAVGLALENSLLLQGLTESEARYRAVLENSPVAVLGLSREHRVTTWNRGAEQIFGYGEDEISGKPISVLFSSEGEADFKQLLGEAINKGSVRDYEIAGKAKNGSRLDLSLSWGGAFQDFWMNREWAVVIRDITGAKKMESQMIHSEKLSAIGQLIASIAHELNNPLQAVVGYAQILADEEGLLDDAAHGSEEKAAAPEGATPSMKEDLRMIFDNAMRCRKIIDNLLFFVRHGAVEKQHIRLDKIVSASVDLLSYKLKKVANVRLNLDIAPDLPRIVANFQQIQQVFVNLINNACDVMEGQDGPKVLSIRAAESGGMVRIEVSDSGPGIPPDLIEKVFEPFFTTKPEGRGTGLGLNVCRQILKEHGGFIGAESRLGGGAKFFFHLPVARSPVSRDFSREASLPKVKGKRVLIVDDEQDVLRFFSKVMLDEGDVVDSVPSVKEAALKITLDAYDLVIADIQLGGGTGISLYENWSRWTPRPRPQFIFLTGDVLNEVLAQSFAERQLEVLHKPVDLWVLQRSVRMALARV